VPRTTNDLTEEDADEIHYTQVEAYWRAYFGPNPSVFGHPNGHLLECGCSGCEELREGARQLKR
jgi:hypothetical protein